MEASRTNSKPQEGLQESLQHSTADKRLEHRDSARSEGKMSEHSQFTSTSRNDISSFRKYRMFRVLGQQSSLLGEECMCRLSTSSKRSCPCQTRGGLCVQSIKWIGLVYQPKEASKLPSLYQNYNRNSKLDLTVLQAEITRDTADILSIWGLTNSTKLFYAESQVLVQLLLNFAKHCIYYRRPTYLKIYGWLAAALLYHCEPYQAFWLLDSITEELDLPTRMAQNCEYTYRLVCAYFKEKVQTMVRVPFIQQSYGVDVRGIVVQLLQDLLCSYMPIDMMGYNLECLMVKGWRHLHQLLLSFIDKRLEVMDKTSPQNRQLIYICLLNNDTQWPLIFFNMESFKKLELSRTPSTSQ